MNTDKFVDFKDLSKKFGQKFAKNSDNEKVVWNDKRLIEVQNVLLQNFVINFIYLKIPIKPL